MTIKIIALVRGDGSGPEMMAVACKIAITAAKMDGIVIVFEETPMGWNAFDKYADTLPQKSLKRAIEIGTIFFGGVGDPKFDNTIGKERPDMKPEARCLLKLRSDMGLLLNFRPMIYYKELAHLANVKPETIPDEGVQQVWIRFLLEDSYFGNYEFTGGFRGNIPYGSSTWDIAKKWGIKRKSDVNIMRDEIVSDLAYLDSNF